ERVGRPPAAHLRHGRGRGRAPAVPHPARHAREPDRAARLPGRRRRPRPLALLGDDEHDEHARAAHDAHLPRADVEPARGLRRPGLHRPAGLHRRRRLHARLLQQRARDRRVRLHRPRRRRRGGALPAARGGRLPPARRLLRDRDLGDRGGPAARGGQHRDARRRRRDVAHRGGHLRPEHAPDADAVVRGGRRRGLRAARVVAPAPPARHGPHRRARLRDGRAGARRARHAGEARGLRGLRRGLRDRRGDHLREPAPGAARRRVQRELDGVHDLHGGHRRHRDHRGAARRRARLLRAAGVARRPRLHLPHRARPPGHRRDDQAARRPLGAHLRADGPEPVPDGPPARAPAGPGGADRGARV
ncbi:MAG: Branched-chain amino acid transport system permease protein LivM, partial [uncultured Solirubrobacteraceae bacterium]